MIRAEQESAAAAKRSPRRELYTRSSSLDRGTSPGLPPLKFTAVNFRKVQRHPPVSYPRKPLVTQRSLGSPPSPNVGSSYSPSSSNNHHQQLSTPSAFAVTSGHQQQQQQPHRRLPYKSSLKRNDAFLKTRSKTISDFFGPESTPISRLLNIICQEKEAERVKASMSSSSGSSSTTRNTSKPTGKDGVVVSKIPMASTAHPAGSSSAASSTSSGVRLLKSRKENVIPVANSHAHSNSSSSVNSGSGGAATELFASKDIDRIAKYKADRRKPIYLRNTVQENENERLEIKKRSSSRSTTNTPSSSAIHSKSQSSTLHPSKAPSSSSSTRAWRAPSSTRSSAASTPVQPQSSTSATTSTTKLHLGVSRGGGGSLPLSPSHQPQKQQQQQPQQPQRKSRDRATTSEEKQVGPAAGTLQSQQQVKQQQPIRTTRSSRLRAAALDKDRASSAGSANASTASEDAFQSFIQRLRVPPSGGSSKLLSPNGNSKSSNNSSISSTSRMSPNISTASSSNASIGGGGGSLLNGGSRLKREPASVKKSSASEAPAKPRLVPTIAVSMKQKLRETTETIKGDINRNRSSTSNSTGRTAMSHINGNDVLHVSNVLNGNSTSSSSAGEDVPKAILNNNPEPGTKATTATVASGEAFFERIPSSTANGGGGTAASSGLSRTKLDFNGSMGSLDSPGAIVNSPRMRTSTMKSGAKCPPNIGITNAGLAASFPKDINGLSPVKGQSTTIHTTVERDKSAKRKSILNRSQHEEATEKRPSSAERRLRQKSGSAPLSSPEPAKSTGRTSISSRSSKSPRHSLEKPSSTPIPSSAPSTAATTPASSPYLTLQSSTTSLATAASTPAPSSTPSTPSKFSLLVGAGISKTPSPAGKVLVLTEGCCCCEPALLHSSSSSTTLAGEVPLRVAVVAGDISSRLDDRVDSRISGGEQEAEVPPDSPLVQQYSKFSQMLKSPTLEKYELSAPAEYEQLEVLEEQEVPLDEQELVPLEVELVLPAENEYDEEGATANIIVIEEDLDLDLMEAGPSGLCPIVIAVDEEHLSSERILEEIRRSGSSSPRPANRILFDDKFNDEFVVIENSPKSHFIQSLDETDIIVIGDNDEDYPPRPASSNSTETGAYEKKLVKMSSVEHFESLHQRKSCSPLRKKSLSPIMRAKSMEESHLASVGSPASNHIVSILKRKTVESNSSASSNASPVTFSPSVVDTPVRSNRRQGILKKRCSLDESRYSRSHSPDDRSILVKHTRRNSFEDGTQHGILKQKSYESKEDVSTTCGSTTAVNSIVSHGILKKKTDSSSTSTPNEQPKHVSISQAVILAAAEICQDMLLDNEHDHEIRPILKSDSQPLPIPKPILKKKYSSESEEIRPILKTSRKSSREENSDSEELKRSILKTDSPAKRRSFGDRDTVDPNTVLIRSRSLEHPEPVVVTPVVPQVQNIEKPIISVAERIKNMEKFLCSGPSTSGAVPKKGGGCANTRRESFRFKTQPVTSTEISGVQQQVDRSVEDQEECSTSSLESGCNQEESAETTCSISESAACPRGSLESLISKEKQPSEDKSLELLSPTLANTESNSHSISGDFNLASLSSDSGIQFGRGTEETSGTDYVSSVKTSDSEKSPSKKTIDDDLNELEEEDDEEHLQIIEETEGQQRLLLSPSTAAAAAERLSTGGRRRATRNSSSSCSSSSSSDLSDRESERMYTATASTSQHQQPDDLYGGSGSPDDESSGLRRSNSVRARANMFQQMESRMKENENPSLPRGRRVMPTAQFSTQTISPTDIDRSHHNLIGSNSSNLISNYNNSNNNNNNSNNNNNISDDSGTEFDPSTLQVSKKIKLFSGGGDENGTVRTAVAARTTVLAATTTTPTAGSGRTLKKKTMKFRTIGKLIMPKFLNDNNNNISNLTPPPPLINGGDSNGVSVGSTIEDKLDAMAEEMIVDGQQQRSLKVERIRKKFMGDSSTPIIGEENGATGDEGSDSNVESGKENNYDSGGEYGLKMSGSCGIIALKRNLLNGNRSHNKSILLNSSAEMEEVVIKGKVSNMAKQWNRLRAMTLDVSAIKTMSTSALQSPTGNGHTPLDERACESLPYEVDSDHNTAYNSTMMEKSSFCINKSKQRNTSQVDDRIAKYFGLKNQNEHTPTSPVTTVNLTPTKSIEPDSTKCRRRSRSMPRGNPPAPPPQRPIDERIAKYFGINKSFNGSASPLAVNKPRAIVRPQKRLLDPDPIIKHLNLSSGGEATMAKGRRRSRSMPREDLDELLEKAYAKKQHATSFCLVANMASLKPLKTFDDFNLTAEDLSMADTEFDKLYLD